MAGHSFASFFASRSSLDVALEWLYPITPNFVAKESDDGVSKLAGNITDFSRFQGNNSN